MCSFRAEAASAAMELCDELDCDARHDEGEEIAPQMRLPQGILPG